MIIFYAFWSFGGQFGSTRELKDAKKVSNPIFPKSTLFAETGRGGGDKRAPLLENPPFLSIFAHVSLFGRFSTFSRDFGIFAPPVAHFWRTPHKKYVSGKIKRRSVQKHTFSGARAHDIFCAPSMTTKICSFGKIHTFS